MNALISGASSPLIASKSCLAFIEVAAAPPASRPQPGYRRATSRNVRMTFGALPDQNSSQLMPLCGLAADGAFGAGTAAGCGPAGPADGPAGPGAFLRGWRHAGRRGRRRLAGEEQRRGDEPRDRLVARRALGPRPARRRSPTAARRGRRRTPARRPPSGPRTPPSERRRRQRARRRSALPRAPARSVAWVRAWSREPRTYPARAPSGKGETGSRVVRPRPGAEPRRPGRRARSPPAAARRRAGRPAGRRSPGPVPFPGR